MRACARLKRRGWRWEWFRVDGEPKTAEYHDTFHRCRMQYIYQRPWLLGTLSKFGMFDGVGCAMLVLFAAGELKIDLVRLCANKFAEMLMRISCIPPQHMSGSMLELRTFERLLEHACSF